MVENAANMGKYIQDKVETMKSIHPSIGDFRNTGLLGCIELVKDRKTKEPLVPWNAKAKDTGPIQKIAASIRAQGMFTFCKWNYIFIAPPLPIIKDQADEGLAIISEAIKIADEHYTGS